MVMFIRDAILTLFPLNIQICPGDAGDCHQSEGQPLTSRIKFRWLADLMAPSPPVSLTDIQQLEISGHDAFENDVLQFPNAFPGGLQNRVSRPERVGSFGCRR